MNGRSSSAWKPWLAATAATLIALAAGALLAPLVGDAVYYGVFLAAVGAAALYAGFWAGIIAVGASYSVASLLLLSRERAWSFDSGMWIYVVASIALAAVCEAVRRARHRAEASAQEVVSIVECINDGFVAIDHQWKCAYANRAAQEMNRRFGGATDMPVIFGLEAEARLRQAAIAHEVAEFEIYYPGGQRWFEIKASPAAAGGLGVFFRDITDRKMAQLALATSEERLRLAQDGARAGLWDRDLISGQLTWSDGFYEINGIDRSVPATRENFLSIVHPDDRAMVVRDLLDPIETTSRIEIIYRIVHAQLRIRWIVARGRVTIDANGTPLRTTGIVLDVTERKRAEESLRFLSEAGTVLSTLVDFASTVQSITRLAVRQFADWCYVEMLSPTNQVERPAFAHRDAAKEPLLKSMLTGLSTQLNSTLPSAPVLEQGHRLLYRNLPDDFIDRMARDPMHRRQLVELDPSSTLIVPLVIRGKVVGALTFVLSDRARCYDEGDLELASELAQRLAVASENARLFADLKEAQRQKDDFLAMLAHELRNPLAAITYANEVSKLQGTGPNEMSETIDRQVTNLCRLLDDLLDVSRITRDKIQLKREIVDGAELVHRAVATLRPLLEDRRHQLVLEVSDEPMRLEVDPIRVEQILGNLLTNAVKYTPPGGTITLRAVPYGDYVAFSVRDTGIGIAPALLPRIFELFMQVDRSRDRSQGGLGVGLTLVRKLAEMHGGSVSAKSDGPGTGSEFTVRLPLADERAAALSGATPDLHAARPMKVLLVDDNVDLATDISKLLRRCGHTVATAHDGLAALETARTFVPDAVLLDLGLPGLDGYRVAQALRREPNFSDVRLIAFSGDGQPEDRKRTRDAGFDQHLVKPVQLQVLLSALAGK